MGARSARRSELWVAGTALVAACAALPLPSHAHSAELAAVLAIGAVAALAGHRWGLAVIVLAEVALVASVWPLAVLARPPSVAAQVAVTVACVSAVPGVLRLVRGDDAVLELLGVTSPRWRRPTSRGLVVLSAVVLAWPLLG